MINLMSREGQSLRALTILLKASGSITQMLKKDMDSYDVNPTEFMVLELLYNKGAQAIQVVGNKVLLASSSITYVIDQLENKNLVQRKQNKKDRRVTLVSLTAEGQELMEEIFPQHSSVIKELFKDLTDQELIKLGDHLKKIGYKAVELNESTD